LGEERGGLYFLKGGETLGKTIWMASDKHFNFEKKRQGRIVPRRGEYSLGHVGGVREGEKEETKKTFGKADKASCLRFIRKRGGGITRSRLIVLNV